MNELLTETLNFWLKMLLVLALLLVLLALAYYYFTSSFSYWKDRGVKFLKPYPVLGSMVKVMTVQEHLLQFNQRVYQEHEGEAFVGFFQGRTPSLLVRDPKLIQNILVKDFSHFTDHGMKVSAQIIIFVTMYYDSSSG